MIRKKPDEKIYARLFDMFSLNPEECFFVDDTEENIAAGRRCGMDGFDFSMERFGSWNKNLKEDVMLSHPIPPLYDEHSKILILGSFPSVKSREQQFFYGHKQNRFWRVMAQVLGCAVPETVEQKKEMLLSHHIAVWDVIASCEITGSSDASIRDVTPNDLSEILGCADIRAIYTNGGKAQQLYQKYIFPVTGREAVALPSTSPANAGYSLERLVEAWRSVRSASEDVLP